MCQKSTMPALYPLHTPHPSLTFHFRKSKLVTVPQMFLLNSCPCLFACTGLPFALISECWHLICPSSPWSNAPFHMNTSQLFHSSCDQSQKLMHFLLHWATSFSVHTRACLWQEDSTTEGKRGGGRGGGQVSLCAVIWPFLALHSCKGVLGQLN